MAFNTNSTERMRIKGGNVGIATNDPKCRLHIKDGSSGFDFSGLHNNVKQVIESNTDVVLALITDVNNSEIWFGDANQQNNGRIRYENQNDIMEFWVNGANRMTLDGSGSIVATGNISGFGTVSDKNLKENIETLENSLETVMKMRPVSFKWKEGVNNERAGTQDDGFIAQEMEEVIPTVVEEIKGSWWSGQSTYKKINYHKLTTYLAGGMQEQQKEIEALKEENTTLKTQLQSILERLSQLESLN
jgi:hypothetical protein